MVHFNEHIIKKNYNFISLLLAKNIFENTIDIHWGTFKKQAHYFFLPKIFNNNIKYRQNDLDH